MTSHNDVAFALLPFRAHSVACAYYVNNVSDIVCVNEVSAQSRIQN